MTQTLICLLTTSFSIMLLQVLLTMLLCSWQCLQSRHGLKSNLSFNTGKCKYMIVSRKQFPSVPCSPWMLFGSPMERVECYKYLGLLLSTNLSWSAHINSICSKAEKILGLIYRSASHDTLKQLYLSLV